MTPGATPPDPAPSPEFSATIRPIDAATARLMRSSGSWRPACPVALRDLRLLTLSYWGFDDAPHSGRLIVHRDVAGAVVRAFGALYRARFPIRRMQLVDAYGASDARSMAADNTSAFNGRYVEGVPGSQGTWSEHAYGRAIDLNPRENPMVVGDNVLPPEGRPYADRTPKRAGMVGHGDAAWRAFAAIGWEWGGDWHSMKDYQHFSATGE